MAPPLSKTAKQAIIGYVAENAVRNLKHISGALALMSAELADTSPNDPPNEDQLGWHLVVTEWLQNAIEREIGELSGALEMRSETGATQDAAT